MNTDEGALGWTVEEVLGRVPTAAQTFVRLRTACGGCALARLCTLADVALAYHISPAALLAALGIEDEEGR